VGDLNDTSRTVALGPRLVASAGFDGLYSDGMLLIEDVARYLDGDGRAQSRALGREASFVYAGESMRLTTRLMQLASWLLLQRAVNEGELSAEAARLEKAKVSFAQTPAERGGPGYDELPNALTAFIAKGDRLCERVLQFDRMERGVAADPGEPVANVVADQLSRLRSAFERLRR